MLLTSLSECILLLFLPWLFYHAFQFARILFKLKKIGKAVDQFPMDKKHWLKGHIDKLSGQGEEGLSYFLELVNKYPRACGLYLLNFLRPYVVVHHPETVRSALKGKGGKPSFLGMYGYGRKWLGGGLLLSNGDKWLRNRKLIENAFHVEALKHYVKVFNEATEIFLSKLSDLAKSKTYFDIQELAPLLAFDVVLRCAFSYKNEIQTEGGKNAYIKATNEVTRLWMKRQFELWKHFDFVYWRTTDGKTFSKYCDDIHDFSNELIQRRRKLIKEHPDEADKYHDFLNILLRSKDEDGVGLTDEEIRDEITTCIAGGIETVSTTLSWALYSLASNPEHQKICQKETDELLKERQCDLLSWNDLQELPYITACLKETLRLYGVPEIEREMDEDVCIDGKPVPAGCSVMINLFNLHRNPDIWKNASKFDPLRFVDEDRKQLDPFAFIPFAAGKRNCIGQVFGMLELKVVVARTLRRYNFIAAENFTPTKRMTITLKSSNGIHLGVSEREIEA